jgi:hypothetical protein
VPNLRLAGQSQLQFAADANSVWMTLLSNGNFGIGTANPGFKLDVAGTAGAWAAHISNANTLNSSYGLYIQAGTSASDYPFYINNAAASAGLAYINGAGNMYVAGNVTASAFFYNSDQRLKKNIEAIASSTALQKVLALQPVTYNWIDPTQPTTTQIGFIAQQVAQVVPELVQTNASTSLMSVDYARVTPLLVGALQAQQARLDAQQKEIDALTAEVEALKAEK